jgi:hypothetical protein
VIYGSMFIIVGALFSNVAEEVLQVFPLPILGVVLLFESLVLLLFVRDQTANTRNFTIAMLTAAIAFALPQGFIIALIVGTALYYFLNWRAKPTPV